jgi:hypothetical protein
MFRHILQKLLDDLAPRLLHPSPHCLDSNLVSGGQWSHIHSGLEMRGKDYRLSFAEDVDSIYSVSARDILGLRL